MEERSKFCVGLDVHKDSISVAAAEPGGDFEEWPRSRRSAWWPRSATPRASRTRANSWAISA